MIEIDGAIGPATSRHVKEALTTAGERRVDVVILRLNTPGGLATSMREMIADVLGSSVPVIGYVAPSGAHAASAGTYILFATHIAAMSPGTNLGRRDARADRRPGCRGCRAASRTRTARTKRTMRGSLR